MSEVTKDRFQVDLRGLIDLLSQHLYSGPAVFVREMLQNCADAIHARQQLEPGFVGTVRIEIIAAKSAPPTLLFQDDGVGLTEEDIHRFLATIGQSSKRPGTIERSGGFLGQFGIGLLACFMVTDEIVVISRSAREGEQTAVEWRGNSDGTYTVRQLAREMAAGTQVYLRAKAGMEEYFAPERLLELARDYGGCLTPAIHLTVDGRTTRVNTTPPWEEDASDPLGRDRLIEYGKATLGRHFLDAVPLRSSAGKIEGVAYVLPQAVHAGANQRHRVYLKNMLLSAKSDDLLPEWAFFVQCVVNAKTLRPTASREAFYEDSALEEARRELGQCLRQYLVDLAKTDARRFQHLISVHHLALKALAASDDECLELFGDWLPFETTLGTMTLGEFRREHPVIRYVPTRDQFRQIVQVAASESIAVINAGYVYDVEILERLSSLRSELQVERFEIEHLSDRFEELTSEEREATVAFERFADATLQPYKCMVELAKFRPVELPALFVSNDNADFLRSVEQSQEVADDLWSGVLDRISEDTPPTYARLQLNYRNPLVRRISQLPERTAQRRCLEMLYVQALLLGHIPLKQNEIKLLNVGLLGLIDWALDLRKDGST